VVPVASPIEIESSFIETSPGALISSLTNAARETERPFAGSAFADVKICQSLDQRFEQIERGATTLEVNAMLFSAADKGCEPLAKKLLDAGASLEARDGRGFNPLARAAKSGQKEIVALFLDRGAQIDARSLEGGTALYEAAETGRLPIVRELVDRGANISLAGRSGITPLAAAAYMGSEPIVELLIEKGADPKVMDKTEKTAIVYAAGRGFPDIVSLLLDRGVDINARYGNDLTVLMWAAGYSDEAGTQDMEKVIKLLLDRGGRIDDQQRRVLALHPGPVAAEHQLDPQLRPALGRAGHAGNGRPPLHGLRRIP